MYKKLDNDILIIQGSDDILEWVYNNHNSRIIYDTINKWYIVTNNLQENIHVIMIEHVIRSGLYPELIDKYLYKLNNSNGSIGLEVLSNKNQFKYFSIYDESADLQFTDIFDDKYDYNGFFVLDTEKSFVETPLYGLLERQKQLQTNTNPPIDIIAYHGSHEDNLKPMLNRAFYLTNEYKIAKQFALGEVYGDGLYDDEIPIIYTCKVRFENPCYITEEEYDDCQDSNIDLEHWIELGYDGLVSEFKNNDIYYICLKPQNVKIIDKEILPYDFDETFEEMAYPISFNMEEFKNISTFKGKIDYCNSRLEKISSGSSRIVYKIDNEKVLKLAKNSKGLAQNQMEYNTSTDNYCSIFAECFDADEENYFWIEMELANKCSKKDFERLAGINFESFITLNHKMYGKGISVFGKLTDQEKQFMETSEFWNNYNEAIMCYDLSTGDFNRLSSWGINHKDELVMIDFGLNDTIYDTMYNKK